MKVGLTGAEWQQLRTLQKAPMHRLREFYRRYRQYILSDGLMHLVFFLA